MAVVNDGLTFPEAPRGRDGKLWFSDVYSPRVLTVDLAHKVETAVHAGAGWP